MTRPNPPVSTPADTGTSQREYGHSSGDRNTRRSENDWPDLEGGIQRDATPGAPGERSAEDGRERG